MLTQLFTKIKTKIVTQKIYDAYIDSIDFSLCQCSCGAIGRFTIHGYYVRSLRYPFLKIQLTILRVKCKSCGRTHAVLHPVIVPYSQIPLDHMLSVIKHYEEPNQFHSNIQLSGGERYHIIKKYKQYWRERLLSVAPPGSIIDLIHSDSFQKKIANRFQLAFMQIHRCFYLMV